MEGLEAERAAVEALRRSTARREEQLEADRRAIEAEAIPERDEESALRPLEPEAEAEPEPEPEPEPKSKPKPADGSAMLAAFVKKHAPPEASKAAESSE